MRYEPEHIAFDFYFFEQYRVKHEQVKKFSDINYQRFLSLCKDETGQLSMTSSINTEWILRSYCATKMIMAATLLLNSAQYCINKNILISVPYLLYYAALSSARGLLYVSPFAQTKDLDGLMTITHSKVLNVVPDLIRNHFDRELGEHIKTLLCYLRNQRELFSYRFPATGICDNINFDETVDVCGLLAELTELSSWQIQKVYEKKFINNIKKSDITDVPWMILDEEIIQKTYVYSKENITGDEIPWIDSEDWYRINYIERKVKYPTSVMNTMTEGMTEDFFGAWCDSEEDNIEYKFNPDKNWNLIFPIP